MSIIVEAQSYTVKGQELFEEGAFSFLHLKKYALDGTPVVQVEKFKGKVLNEFERNGYDDSDFYAVVWDEEKQEPKTIQYATTRGWTYCNSATIDATPEVLEQYAFYKARMEEKHRFYQKALEKHIPKVGSLIKSKTTKGKAKGKTGIVEWIGSTPFSQKAVRIDGSIFIEVKRIEIWDEQSEQFVECAEWYPGNGYIQSGWDVKSVRDQFYPSK